MRTKSILGLLAIAGAAAVLSGCGGTQQARDVAAADFAASQPLPGRVVKEPEGIATSDELAVEIASARTLLPTVILEPGEPSLDEPAERRGDAVLVDAKVGDVNGRPIQASTFFEPMEARLIAEAERLGPREWRRFARQLIASRLNLTVEDELLESEALELLPEPMRKTGLRNFVESIREDKISRAGGSRSVANDRALGETGRTVDEEAEDQLTRELVTLAYQKQIQGKVHVSRHDIELHYERNYGRYNPTPAAIFQRIRISKRDAEAIERVTERLESGAEFGAVAADTANSETEPIRQSFPGPDAGYDEIVVFAGDRFKDANEEIRGLVPGEWAGPIDFGTSVQWYQLLEIDEPDRMSLYEAQRSIEARLREQRNGLEAQRYLTELKRRASFTDLGDMTERLLEIAENRYYRADRG